jgi:chaperone LolA
MKYLIGLLTILLLDSISFSLDNILLSNVKAKYDKIKTIQGDFFQTLCSENEGTCQSFEGKFSISRPYFSRLEVTKPEKQTIVTDSTNLYIYLVNKKKVYIQSANAGVNFFKIFDMFLNDTVNFIMASQDSEYSVLEYKKDTLHQSNMFKDLKLHLNRMTNLIEQFSFTDVNGAETKFELTNITINPKLSNKLFKLEILKGTEIIKY